MERGERSDGSRRGLHPGQRLVDGDLVADRDAELGHLPSIGAAITSSIFIDSSTTTGSPARTRPRCAAGRAAPGRASARAASPSTSAVGEIRDSRPAAPPTPEPPWPIQVTSPSRASRRGDIPKLEQHLSNHCPEAPGNVVRKYITKIIERNDKPSKKRKIGQQTIDSYHDYAELPGSRITRINRALVKFFIACGISFRIVEHPFFVNLMRELNGGYNPPSREVLANQLLERELAQVQSKVKSELEKETDLTLGLLNHVVYHKSYLILLTIYNIIYTI